MREIAGEAGVSLGLSYRYFARKEDLAVALYSDLGRRLRRVAEGLYGGSIASRFETMMRATIENLELHREAFTALAARAFDPSDDIGVLGPQTEPIRAEARRSWELVVEGADDAPKSAIEREQLADALYAADLLIVLIWTQDKAADRAATAEAVQATTQAISLLRPFLVLPMGAIALQQVASIAGKLGIGRQYAAAEPKS